MASSRIQILSTAMKTIVITLCTLATALATPEPPAGGSGYLPPHGGSHGSGDYNANGITGAIVSPFGEPNDYGFGGNPSDTYRHPSLGFDGYGIPSSQNGNGLIGHGHTNGAHPGSYGDRLPSGSHGASPNSLTRHLSSSYSAANGHDAGVHFGTGGGHGFNGFAGNGHASGNFGHGNSHGSGSGSYGAHTGNGHTPNNHGAGHLGTHDALVNDGSVGNGHTPGAHSPTNGHGDNGVGPSSAYGAPHSNGFGLNGVSRPSSSYGAPHGQGSNGVHHSSAHGAPHSNGFGLNGVSRPSSSYGAPHGQGSNGVHHSSAHGAPHSNGFGLNGVSRPSTAYGAPHGHGSNDVHHSSAHGQPHGNGIGGNGHHSNHLGAHGGAFERRPSSAYGAPSGGNGGHHAAAVGYPGGTGGFTGGVSGYGGGIGNEISQPASYSFHYDVNDGEGTEFGHRESREGDEAQGEFRVLLPDGRRQIVSYTADHQGYLPEIRYEDTGNGGYAQHGPGGNGAVHGGVSGQHGY